MPASTNVPRDGNTHRESDRDIDRENHRDKDRERDVKTHQFPNPLSLYY